MTARQGLNVSIKQLKELIVELEQNTMELHKRFRIGERCNTQELTFSVPIINKTPECSDTWELE